MVELFRKLLISALTLGAIAGNGDEIRALFDSTVAYTQQIATAGDLRTIGYMLDYSFLKTGRYPAAESFTEWLRLNVRESTGRDLGRDHWGRPYLYETTPDRKGFVLLSAGTDGVTGTGDDLQYSGP